MLTGDLLELVNISREHSGEYFCNAENGVGSRPVREGIIINVLCKLVNILQCIYKVAYKGGGGMGYYPAMIPLSGG